MVFPPIHPHITKRYRPWNISTGIHKQTVDFSAQDAGWKGIFFKDDGTKMFFSNILNDRINEGTLSTAWDVTTLSIDTVNVLSTAGLITDPRSIHITPNGFKLHVLGEGVSDQTKVFQFTLGNDVD